MLIGYARVSKHDQNLSLQQDALKNAGCDKIFVDEISGSIALRKGLLLALEVLREGDILIVWRLDRLGRSLKHLIELIKQLETRKIGFKSLAEGIDTTSSGGKLIFHIFGALAEFEKSLIRERTLAGLAAARSRGKLGGRPNALDLEKRKAAIKLYKDRTGSVREVCRIMGISKPTLYSYLRNDSIQP